MEDVITGTSIKTNYICAETIFYFGVVTYEMEKYEYTSNNNNFVKRTSKTLQLIHFSFTKENFHSIVSSKLQTSNKLFRITIGLHFPAIKNLSEPLELLEPKIFNKRQACFLLGNFHFHVACFIRDIAINKHTTSYDRCREALKVVKSLKNLLNLELLHLLRYQSKRPRITESVVREISAKRAKQLEIMYDYLRQYVGRNIARDKCQILCRNSAKQPGYNILCRGYLYRKRGRS